MSWEVDALQALVRIPTVSYPDEERIDHDAFDEALSALATHFPLLHQHGEFIRIGRSGQLIKVTGASSERPTVLMAHLDVVPVDDPDLWQFDPFGAEIHHGVMWGRGTLDDKGSLVAICSAVERLLSENTRPAQDVWLSFGAREEVFGSDAALAVEQLRERGVAPWLVLDEGGAVAGQAFPRIDAPLAVIGTGEKGMVTITLTASGRGGHASTPAKNGPVARIARALSRIERRPFPSRLPFAAREMFRRLAPHAPKTLAPLLRHADRLSAVLTRVLAAASPETAAMVRTTVAATTLSGSAASNVIAASASVSLNLRLAPRDSVARAVRRIRRVIADDSIKITIAEASEPSATSPLDDRFALLERIAKAQFPDAIVTPYLVMAATDSRFFTRISNHVYRFAPLRMSAEQRASLHSHNERLGVDDYLAGVDYYETLLRSL